MENFTMEQDPQSKPLVGVILKQGESKLADIAKVDLLFTQDDSVPRTTILPIEGSDAVADSEKDQIQKDE